MEQHTVQERTIKDYLSIIWRRKWMIGIFVAFTTAVVYVGTDYLQPVYEASSTLHIKDQKPSVLEGSIFGAGISNEGVINTYIEMLKSRSVLEDVIHQLNLVDSFDIDPELSDEERFAAAYEVLEESVRIRGVTNAALIRISARSSEKELAREMAAAIASSFIQRNIESRRREANAVLDFISIQLDQMKEKVRIAEDDLLAYKNAEGIRILDEEARYMVDQLAGLERMLQDVTVSREVLNTRRNLLTEQLQANRGSAGRITKSPEIDNMQRKLTELQSKLFRMERESGTPATDIEYMRSQINALKAGIQEELRNAPETASTYPFSSALQMKMTEYEMEDIVLASQEAALREAIREYEAEIGKMPLQEINLIRLERNRRINDEIFTTLTKAKNEAEIEAASQIGNIEVLDPAFSSVDPVWPDKTKNIIMAVAVSLILGMAIAFMIELSDNTVRSEDEVKSLLGVPVLGMIPRYTSHVRLLPSGKGSKQKAGTNLITRDDPYSLVSEGFRLIRTNLTSSEKVVNTLLITSPVPGEGKTTVASNLAVVLASMEKRVLLVDADLRRPMVHKLFDIPDVPGLTDVLLGQILWKDAVKRVNGMENLHILTSGSIQKNTSELLGSSEMQEFICELKKHYDHVIFDAPPAIAVTDALVLASFLDGVLVVTHAGQVDKRAVARMKELMKIAKVPVLGGILNGVDLKDKRHGYGRYYQYYYYGDFDPKKR